MAFKDDILAFAQDWKTVRQTVEATGKPYRRVLDAMHRMRRAGVIEERFEDGVGFVFRARPGITSMPRARQPCLAMPAITEALRDGPKTVRQISGEDGWSRKEYRRVYALLYRAEGLG